MGKREHGISLSELLLVVASVAMLGAGMLTQSSNAKIKANERAAIVALKNIAAAQQRCQSSVGIDVDDDRQGEFGFMAELAGTASVRNSVAAGRLFSPPLLSIRFGLVWNSYASVSGYNFRIFLPNFMGEGVTELSTGGDSYNSQGVSPDLAELWWCCYAWPVGKGRTGHRTFFVNQSGEILATNGAVVPYTGNWFIPAQNAAFLANSTGFMGEPLAASSTGCDGNFWHAVE